jgi:hypothetical protein
VEVEARAVQVEALVEVACEAVEVLISLRAELGGQEFRARLARVLERSFDEERTVTSLIRRPVVHPDDLLAAVDAVEQQFAVRLKSSAVESFDAGAQRRLVALARRGSELDAGETKELTKIVEQAAPGLLKAAREAEEARARRVQEWREAAQGPARRALLPEGAAALPAGVLDDALARDVVRLRPGRRLAEAWETP